MKYTELINFIKDIPIEKRIISLYYDVWDDFLIKKNWDMYYITIKKWHNNKSNDFIFNSIIKSINWIQKITPKILQLWWEQSVEMLYHHYKYWYDNNSNCVLFNTSNKILAIQYNQLEKTNYLKTDCIYVPNYIIINNKKKIKWIYKIKDYNILLPLLKKICVE